MSNIIPPEWIFFNRKMGCEQNNLEKSNIDKRFWIQYNDDDRSAKREEICCHSGLNTYFNRKKRYT